MNTGIRGLPNDSSLDSGWWLNDISNWIGVVCSPIHCRDKAFFLPMFVAILLTGYHFVL